MGLIGDVTPGITALSAQLPGLIDKLAGTEHDDIAQLLTAAQADIDKITSGELAIVKAAEDPILTELQAWRAAMIPAMQTLVMFTNGFEVIPRAPKT